MKRLRNLCRLLLFLVLYLCQFQYEGINFVVALRTRFNQFCPVNVPTPNFQFNVSKLQERSKTLYLQFTSNPSICSQAQCGCVTMKLKEKHRQLTCLITEYNNTGNQTKKTRMVFAASEATSYRKLPTTIEIDQNGENPVNDQSTHVFFTDYSTFLVIWQCDSNFHLKNIYLATYDPEMSQKTIIYINSILPQFSLINYLTSNRISRNYCKYIAAQSSEAINENVKNISNNTSAKIFVPNDVAITTKIPTTISIFPTVNTLANFSNKTSTNSSKFLHLDDVTTAETPITETVSNITRIILQNFLDKASSSSESNLNHNSFTTKPLETTTSQPTTKANFPTFPTLKVTTSPKWILDFQKTIITVSPLKKNISSISAFTIPKIKNVTKSSTFHFPLFSAITNIILGNAANANKYKVTNKSSVENLNEASILPITTVTTTDISVILQTNSVKNGNPSSPVSSHPSIPSGPAEKVEISLFNYSGSLYNNSLTQKSPSNSPSTVSFSIIFLLLQPCIVFLL